MKSRILVVLDADQEHQKALSRALQLAVQLDATVTAFLSIYDFSYEMTTMLAADEREAMRQGLIADREIWIRDNVQHLQQTLGLSVAVDHKVVWHNRPFEAIVRTAIEGDYQLIMKATHVHDGLQNLIFTPTDWHLLRKAHCPVLLVKDHDWAPRGKILAAVHVGGEDEAHHNLNRRIVEQAQRVAEQTQAQVHLVNAFPVAPVTIAMEIPEFDLTDYRDAMRTHHHQAMQQLASEFGISNACTHVIEGAAERVIPEYAIELDCELVVIGTIGRSGLSAALLGNTAEHIIEALNCDLLAIKPAGFKSPVTL